MLRTFSAYIHTISVFLVFSSLVLLLAPSERSKAYLRLTLGFSLVLLTIKPLGDVYNALQTWNGTSGLNSNSYTVSVFNAYSHDDFVISAYEESLQTHLEYIVSADAQFTLLSSEFTIAREGECFGLVEAIHMTLMPYTEKPVAKPFLRIEPIHIRSGPLANNAEEEAELPAVVALKNTVSSFYNLPAQHIHCIVQVNEREME